MQKNFETLIGHTIIIGYGRNGKQTVKELIRHGHKVLVIDSDDSELKELESYSEAYYLVGDATLDEVLHTAGLANARALITTLPKDADNLFTVLTARIINPKIPIISRASEMKSIKKLKSAGANEIIMPDMLGGQKMAQLVLEPDVVEFIDYILLQDEEQVNLEEISVKHLASNFVNKTIRELNIRNISGANIIGLKTNDNQFVLNPPSDYSLEDSSNIFALGEPDQIKRLKKLITTGQ